MCVLSLGTQAVVSLAAMAQSMLLVHTSEQRTAQCAAQQRMGEWVAGIGSGGGGSYAGTWCHAARKSSVVGTHTRVTTQIALVEPSNTVQGVLKLRRLFA